jgi:hypothetical protein
VFKIGTLVFQVVTLTKRQQDNPLLGSVKDSIRHFFFFIIIRDSFLEINP